VCVCVRARACVCGVVYGVGSEWTISNRKYGTAGMQGCYEHYGVWLICGTACPAKNFDSFYSFPSRDFIIILSYGKL